MPSSPPSRVTFSSCKVKELRRDATLPAKFERQLASYPLKDMFDGQQVAIKMHVGGDIGYTTVHPLFARIVVKAVKNAGGQPFITDGTGSRPNAVARGYTEEVLGAPFIEAAGVKNRYSYPREIGHEGLDSVDLCGNIVDADAMIVLSHGKGHGHCGFGGAIKNLAMGCVAGDTRGKIHRLCGEEFLWEADKCAHCQACIENCPTGNALHFDEKDELKWFDHNCRFCRHCDLACPTQAIHLATEGIVRFQHGMARVTKAVLDTFSPNRVLFVNILLNVTPYCDCWGFSTPSLVPDLGILAATDVVAIEQASLDLIRTEHYIEGSLPEPMRMGDGAHLFEKIHGKDPYLQVACAESIGLGTRAYTLESMD